MTRPLPQEISMHLNILVIRGQHNNASSVALPPCRGHRTDSIIYSDDEVLVRADRQSRGGIGPDPPECEAPAAEIQPFPPLACKTTRYFDAPSADSPSINKCTVKDPKSFCADSSRPDS